jgi:PKD repeat protein
MMARRLLFNVQPDSTVAAMNPRRHMRPLRANLAIAVAVLVMSTTAPASAATVPNAPSGLAAHVGSGVIALVWADNASDETGFEIERCAKTSSGCAFAPIATTGTNAAGYADVSALGAYRYRVRAVNAAGASAWSAEAALPGSLSLGGYPTAVLTAIPTTGDLPLTVAFDGSRSTWLELAVITSYSWSFGDGSTASGPTVSHTYTAPGTYRATLTVANAAEVADLTSTTVTVTAQPPGAPADLTASTAVKRRISLHWTNPPATNATFLTVSRCTGARCKVLSRVATLPATATTWTDTTVRAGTTYSYLVAASNGHTSSSSQVVTVRAR